MIINSKHLFKAFIVLIVLFLFTLPGIATSVSLFYGIAIIIIWPLLTMISSIYFARTKLIKNSKKIFLILPSIGFAVALVLGILLQVYFSNADRYYHYSGQISMGSLWPFIAVACIVIATVINLIIATILYFLLKFDKIEFMEI